MSYYSIILEKLVKNKKLIIPIWSIAYYITPFNLAFFESYYGIELIIFNNNCLIVRPEIEKHKIATIILDSIKKTFSSHVNAIKSQEVPSNFKNIYLICFSIEKAVSFWEHMGFNHILNSNIGTLAISNKLHNLIAPELGQDVLYNDTRLFLFEIK